LRFSDSSVTHGTNSDFRPANQIQIISSLYEYRSSACTGAYRSANRRPFTSPGNRADHCANRCTDSGSGYRAVGLAGVFP
jgi:hypothetical protein